MNAAGQKESIRAEGSGGAQHAAAEQIKAGAAIHLALQHLEAIDLPSAWPLLHGSSRAACTAA
jgi:hypothetical protein